MAAVQKIDSNATGLRYAEEESIGVLPGTPTWVPLEPNSYSDFGGQITTVARNPINASRQRKKGVTTDLDASGGFNMDLTQSNFQDLAQGLFFADLRRKNEYGVDPTEDFTAVDGTNDEYEAAAGLDVFPVGALIFAAGFGEGANNGLKRVTTSTATALEVAEDLVDETPGAGVGSLVEVGFQFGTGEVDIDESGSTLPKLVRASGSKDFTDFGLIPGEYVFIGGDAAGEKFTTAGNNGFARVRSVSATEIEFDLTQGTMADETGTGKTIRIFFGRVLKNEQGTDIVRRTYSLERTLGAPDDASPSQVQAEYLDRCIFNEWSLNLATADKVTMDLTFVGGDNATIDGPTSLRTGNRPALVEADAFNTSSDVTLIRLAVFTEGSPNPTPLFAFVQELTLTVSNNASPNKAVGTLGAFEVTAGQFAVSGSMNAYFSNVAAIQSVRNNDDINLYFHLVKANAGMTFDVPLITLGDGRPNVEQDQPILIPLSTDAATGAKIHSSLDHTLMLCFFDYLPDAAE